MDDGDTDGQIVINVVADENSELTEQFELMLTGADGGADIDSQHQISVFSIRFVVRVYSISVQ